MRIGDACCVGGALPLGAAGALARCQVDLMCSARLLGSAQAYFLPYVHEFVLDAWPAHTHTRDCIVGVSAVCVGKRSKGSQDTVTRSAHRTH